MGKKTIEFGELRISKLAKKHIKDCIKRDWVSIGPKTKLFEEKWQNLFGYNHTVMVNSGTSADTAACMALYEYDSLRQGDYIICPALSFIATANSIRAAGFEPLFIDVDKETLKSRINDQINFYVPEIELVDTTIDLLPDNHTLYIKLTYRFVLDNTMDSIQLNFK